MDQPAYACPRCAAPISAGQPACTRCGLALDPASLAAFQAQQAAYYPPPAGMPPAGGPALAARRARVGWGVLGLAVVVLLCCGGSALFLVTNTTQLFTSLAQDSAATTTVIQRFMQAGERNDAAAGYALFASAATDVTQADIARLFDDHPEFFAGFQTARQENYQLFSGTQGTTADVTGRITYRRHAEVPFSARLMKVNNRWALVSFQLAQGVGR
jgi:hypothetical protein